MEDITKLKQACSDFLVYKKRSSFSYSEFINGIVINLLSINSDLENKHQLTVDKANHKVKNMRNKSLSDEQLIQLGLFTENSIEELLWHFINSGIITKRFHNFRLDPGTGKLNIFDYFNVTQWGLNVLSGIKPTPYDYEGYLSNIKKEISNIDEITVFYLELSLQCFNKYLYNPSAVMLGAAAENIILLLMDIVSKKQSSNQKFLKEVKNGKAPITIVYNAIKKRIDPIKNSMTNELKESWDLSLEHLWTVIRISRNEAGHPTKVSISRDRAHSNLIIFREYCRSAFKLIKWLEKQESI